MSFGHSSFGLVTHMTVEVLSNGELNRMESEFLEEIKLRARCLLKRPCAHLCVCARLLLQCVPNFGY